MNLKKLLSKIKLSYSDPTEEEEYNRLKLPLLKDFLAAFLLCMIASLVPLSINFFLRDGMMLNGLLAIGMLVIAIFMLLAKKFLGKWMEYAVIGYLLVGVVLVVINLNPVLTSLKSCVSFYGGFSFALIHRLFGYRIINVHSMIILHVISFSLRIIFLYDHEYSVTIMAGILEFFSLCLGIKSEKGDRALFDSLYRSKGELLKFKDFFMDHFPSQMVILTKDYSGTKLINTPFRKNFECDDMYELKCSLKRLVLDKEFCSNNVGFLARIGYIPDKNPGPLTLSQLIWLLSKDIESLRCNKILTFDVFEDKNEEENSLEQVKQVAKASYQDDNVKRENRDEKCFTNREKEHKFIQIYLEEARNAYTERVVQQKHDKKDSKHNSYQEQEELQSIDLIDRIKASEEQKKRYLKVKVFLLQWDGDEVITVTLDDITSQKVITETKLANMNKDLVTQMISKDLIDPVQNMVDLMEAIKKKAKDSTILPYINVCRNNGVVLRNFVNSLLDLSLIQNNKFKLSCSKVILQDVIDEINYIFKPLYQMKSLYFKVELGKDLPKVVLTDRNRLSQIIVSILVHTFKLTFEGGIVLKVGLDHHNPSKIRFLFKDTGIGIDKEEQKGLFKLCRQDTDSKLDTEALNVNLAISNILAGILNQSEGTGIIVESEPGRGSIFSFLIQGQHRDLQEEKSSQETCTDDNTSFIGEDEGLPLKNIESPFIKRNSESVFLVRNRDSVMHKSGDQFFELIKTGDINSNRRSSRGFLLKNKVSEDVLGEEKPWCLIVDNNPLNLMVTHFLMEERGYKVKAVLNSKKAVNQVIEHEKNGFKFKIILIELKMSVMDGYEVAKGLTKMMETSKINKCPIVGCVDLNEAGSNENKRKEAGITYYLVKPLQSLDLDEILRKIHP